jgi:hypothetical protein
MVWTTYDISSITDQLVTQLTDAVASSKLWKSNNGLIPNFQINVTGNSPDTMRHGQEGECQLNLYLLHVAQNPYLRNTPILGAGAMANTQQPLSLDLTYLLTAYAHNNADREQQAMSIALTSFHEQPVYTAPGGEYLTIGLGTDTLSEMSALWQSFTVAYRLSTIYRVAVALLTPSATPAALPQAPATMNLVVAPAVASLDTTPQVFQTARQITFTVPAGDTDDPDVVTTRAAPLVVTGGVRVLVGGQGLSTTPPIDVFLATIDGTSSWKVTSWVITGTDLASDLVMQPPSAYALTVAAVDPLTTTPPPGVYMLSVGAGSSQSAAVPVIIVPRFADVLSPPVLPLVGGVYTAQGAGFIPGATQLFLGGAALAAVLPPAAPGTGQFVVAADGTSVAFLPPSGLTPGLAALRVRVDGVDAPPTWQVNIP